MKKEIIQLDNEKKVWRITTTDERWYAIENQNKETGLPEFNFLPSVTWISSFYPKGIAFYKWLANKGWDESEALKIAAGDKGSKVHNAIENLIKGEIIKLTDKYFNNSTEKDEELKPEEYEAILSFASWYNEYKPEFLLKESTVTSEEYGYAGTVDCVCKIEDQVYIIDFKTSQYIWPEYEIQLAAYKQALKESGKKTENAKLAILQLGYKKNKKLFKFTEIEDKLDLFLHARAIWENETKGQSPKQVEYPLEIKLIKEIKVEPKKKSYYKSKKQ